MDPNQLAQVLVMLGCPAEKSVAMVAQLDKRACQLVAEKSRSYEEALTHLLKLMREGWAAKQGEFIAPERRSERAGLLNGGGHRPPLQHCK